MMIIDSMTGDNALKKMGLSPILAKSKIPYPDFSVTDPRDLIGNKRKFKSPEELLLACSDYFIYCYEAKEIPTISGLEFYLGFYRGGILLYEQGKYDESCQINDADPYGNGLDTVNPLYSHIVKTAKQFVYTGYEQLLLTVPKPAGIIFALKNHFNWRDISEVKHSGSIDHNLIIGEDEMLKLQGKPCQTIEIEALSEHDKDEDK